MEQKTFFIIFKGFSMKQITQIFLEGKSPTLTLSYQKLYGKFGKFIFFSEKDREN